MSKALTRTDFNFPGQKSVYHGKVRDVYNINDEKLVMVATDRISAFDVVLPEGIPYKGQMLNQLENGDPRSYGYRRSYVSRFSCGNDCPWLPVR